MYVESIVVASRSLAMPLSSTTCMTEDQPVKSSKRQGGHGGQRRLSRNESEKLRRDKLNMHIAELAKLVPMVATAPRKLDKSSVLRLSVNYLRTHYELKKAARFELQRPSFLSKHCLEELLLETSDGFLLIVSQTGNILYTSHMISSLLGHYQVDVVGTSVYQLIHPDDIDLCKEQFESCETSPHISAMSQDMCVGRIPITSAYAMPRNGRRSFYVRMLNVLHKDQKSYELIHMVFHVRNFTLPQKKDAVIVGVGRLVTQQPIHEMTVQPSNSLGFVSQHSLDGKFIYSDQRQALCNGRLPHEVYGKVPYDFILEEDLPVVQFSHQRIMVEGEIGSTVFRSFAKTGEIIYMESSSIIWLDKWTKAPKFIVSNNILISEKAFEVQMCKQRSLMIKAGEQSDSESDGEESDIKRPRLDAEIIDITNSPAEQPEDINLPPDTVSTEQILTTPTRDRPPDGCSPQQSFQLDQAVKEDSVAQTQTPKREKPSAVIEIPCNEANKATEKSSTQSTDGLTSLLNRHIPQRTPDPKPFKISACVDEKHISDQAILDKHHFSPPVSAIEIGNNQDPIDATICTFETKNYDDPQIYNYRIESPQSNTYEQHSSPKQKSGRKSNIKKQGNQNFVEQDICASVELNSVISKQHSVTEEGWSVKPGLICETENSLSHPQTRERSKEEQFNPQACEAASVMEVLDDQGDTFSSSLVNTDGTLTHTIQQEDNDWLQGLASSAISSPTDDHHLEKDQLSVSPTAQLHVSGGVASSSERASQVWCSDDATREQSEIWCRDGSSRDHSDLCYSDGASRDQSEIWFSDDASRDQSEICYSNEASRGQSEICYSDEASRGQSQSDLKRVLIQTHLANQLKTKYQQLGGRLKRQECELSDLKNVLLKYVLSHPEAREEYLERLDKLESKRQSHEEYLISLQNRSRINSMTRDKRTPASSRVMAGPEKPSARNKVPESIIIPSDLSTCLPFTTYSDKKSSTHSLFSDRGDNSTKAANIPAYSPDLRGSNHRYKASCDGSAACAHYVPRTDTDRQSLFAQFLDPGRSQDGSQHINQEHINLLQYQSSLHQGLVDKQLGLEDQHKRGVHTSGLVARTPVYNELSPVYGHTPPHIDQNYPLDTGLTAATSNLPTPLDVLTDMNSPQTEGYERVQPGLLIPHLTSPVKDPAARVSSVKQGVDSRGPDTSHQSAFDYLNLV